VGTNRPGRRRPIKTLAAQILPDLYPPKSP